MNIKNINSTHTVVNRLEDYIYEGNKIGFLSEKLRELPVHLVNEPLMDKLYPPGKLMEVNIERLKDRLSKVGDINKFMEDLPMKEVEKEKSFVAVGLYTRNIEKDLREYVEKQFDHELGEGPYIFICPERIRKWADRTSHSRYRNKKFLVLFSKVLFHELAHAYMDKDNKPDYNKPWVKLIEESLANAIAYSRFKQERGLIAKAIDKQSFEYRAYKYHFESFFPDKLYSPSQMVIHLARMWRDPYYSYLKHPFYFMDLDYWHERHWRILDRMGFYFEEIFRNPELF